MNNRFFTEGHGRLARVDRGGGFQPPSPRSLIGSADGELICEIGNFC